MNHASIPRCLVVCCMALLISASMAQSGTKTPAWKRWKGQGCTLTYPAHWAVAEAVGGGITVVFRAPLDSGDVFQENINLMVQAAPNVTIEEYVRNTIAQIAQHLQQAKVISSVPGGEADSHVFEYSGIHEGRELHWVQHVFLRNGSAYLLTYTAEEHMFEEYRYLADAAMDSFTHP